MFHVDVTNDDRVDALEHACAVEVLTCAPSRMEATVLLRQRGSSAVRSRELKVMRAGHPDAIGQPLPTAQPGEVWARTVYVAGPWQQR
ncbi:hypothetical protein [uncultured Cellulomonas sp.]|uniref:hypothetical protein n=1 Tax=uncultured Cellulomonas sp. TaxID=189682 RepID=UPI0026284163|nr:hypothetical protein [uncultured Cellulomonas sp.]